MRSSSLLPTTCMKCFSSLHAMEQFSQSHAILPLSGSSTHNYNVQPVLTGLVGNYKSISSLFFCLSCQLKRLGPTIKAGLKEYQSSVVTDLVFSRNLITAWFSLTQRIVHFDCQLSILTLKCIKVVFLHLLTRAVMTIIRKALGKILDQT